MGNERQVPGDDDFGASSDSRNCRHDQSEEPAGEIAQAHGEVLQQRSDGGSTGQRESEGEGDLREIDLEVTRVLEAEFGVAHVGPIPDPATLEAYPLAVKDKIIEWQDRKIKAMFDDESKRQDDIVAAEIRRGNRGQWLSFVINAVLIFGTLIAFVVTGKPSVFWAYTLLGANAAANVIITINKNKNSGGGGNDSNL